MHKLGSRKGIVLVAGGVLVLLICLACTLPLLYFVIHPWLNTEYAARYSEDDFCAVALGDSEQRVLGLLGEPLERIPSAHDPTYVYLHYSRAVGRSDSYLSRIILLKDGQVLKKWHELYLD